MTELAVRPNGWGVIDHQQPAPAPAGPSLSEWVEQAREVASVADMLCRTSFVPKAFQGKPAECAAAILAGQEMGMSPMASLRAIDVIEGKPGLTALGLRAQVQSRGHEIWTQESTATRAIVCGRRRGSDKVEKSVWTTERAATFGLLGKKNWKEQPTSMLLARATAECARLVAADALLGMPYSTEELGDGVDQPTGPEDTTAAPTARKTARRKASPAPAPAAQEEPAFDDEPGPPPEPEPPLDSMTGEQSKKLHAALRDAGYGQRADGLAYISQRVGREVTTTKELSKQEASRLIDGLEGPPLPDDPEPGFDGWPSVPEVQP